MKETYLENCGGNLIHLDFENVGTDLSNIIYKKNDMTGPIWTLVDDRNPYFNVWHKKTLIDNGYNECFDKKIDPNAEVSKIDAHELRFQRGG